MGDKMMTTGVKKSGGTQRTEGGQLHFSLVFKREDGWVYRGLGDGEMLFFLFKRQRLL